LLRTLHGYLSRELTRVAALSLVAFTVVMTIFAIIEPLRKQGLSTHQAAAFFGYTLPVMLSLTLPVASLFAATIVYGRFSQDNELLACRASGISTISLLRPALVLGGIVTAVSLGLNSFIAPKLAQMGEDAIRNNVRNIVYHRLRTRGYLKLDKIILHADRVFPDRDALRGVVVIDTARPRDTRMLVAAKAHVRFDREERETSCSVHLNDLAVVRTGSNQVFWEDSQQTPPRRLPSLTRHKAAFFDWTRLLRIRANPTLHPEIHRELVGIRREICRMMFAKEVSDAISAGKPYVKLRAGQDVYEISAGACKVVSDGSAVLSSGLAPDGSARRVQVVVRRNGRIRQRIVSDRGKVEAQWLSGWQADQRTWLVSISLDGPAEVYFPGLEAEPSRRGGWRMGRCALPEGIAAEAESINLDDLYERAEQVTANPFILKRIKWLKEDRVPKLMGRVISEIHGRLAYCLSCFLLVAMGAALGLMFRGGQMISAFALTIVPAAVVIVMVLMGKEMVSNPDSSKALGLAAIWGGDLAMLVADGVIYAYLRNFLMSALLWFVVLMSLRVVVDLFINMDEFTEGQRNVSEILSDVVNYYSYQSLVYVVEMGGLIIVASAAFSLARMNHTNELTAMLASGVSLYRVIWPVVLCSMLMGGLIILDRELIIPDVADKLVRERDDVVGKEQFTVPVIVDGNGAAWHAKAFRPDEDNPWLEKPVILIRDDQARLIAPVTGTKAVPAKVSGVRGWLIENGKLTLVDRRGQPWPNLPDTQRVFTQLDPAELLRRAGADPDARGVTVESVDGRDEVYGLRLVADRFLPDDPSAEGPRGGTLVSPKFVFTGNTGKKLCIFLADRARWIPPSENLAGYWRLEQGRLFYPSDLSPQDIVLRRSSGWLDYLSASQLAALLRMRRVPDPQSVQMVRHVRFTEPLNNLIMLLLGLPFVISRQRNIKASAGLCLLVVGVFYAFVYISRYVAPGSALAAWLPIIIFGGIAAVMLDAIKT